MSNNVRRDTVWTHLDFVEAVAVGVGVLMPRRPRGLLGLSRGKYHQSVLTAFEMRVHIPHNAEACIIGRVQICLE